jgi:hypothetical protein
MTEIASSPPSHLRLAAALIGGAALIGMVLVTHHPVVSSTGPQSGIPFGGLAAIMQTNLTFHAILMLVVVGQLLGIVLFARRLGFAQPLVLIGTLLCGFAAVLLVIAMTFDGFVVYELISRCRASSAGCTDATADALRLTMAIIQGFTKLGFGAQCLGFVALGVASWSLGGKIRIAAAASVIAAAAPIVMITSGRYVGPQQLAEILALLAGWGLCVAAILIMESFRRPGEGAAAKSLPPVGA